MALAVAVAGGDEGSKDGGDGRETAAKGGRSHSLCSCWHPIVSRTTFYYLVHEHDRWYGITIADYYLTTRYFHQHYCTTLKCAEAGSKSKGAALFVSFAAVGQ